MDLSQTLPTEYRADSVTVVRRGDDAIGAVIVEVQRASDDDKHWTWPLYVTALRAPPVPHQVARAGP